MALSDYLRPEYVFRPTQIWRRVQQKLHPQVGEFDDVSLPWGLPLRVRSFDFIGLHIRWFGAFDLCVSETIWRLLKSGDTAIDVGANLGYMTSLMSAKVGATGCVVAVEPHPELYQELLTNIHLWQQIGFVNVQAENLALGDRTGEAILRIPTDFGYNRGLASLIPDHAGDHVATTTEQIYRVQLRQLDDLVNDQLAHKQLVSDRIGLLKIDVEGNELSVLEGARELIRQQRIRDIVFEDFGQYPTPVTQFLEAQGYTLFYLGKRFLGLAVGAIQDKLKDYPSPTPEGPSYLATIAPDRALARLRPWGWGIFGVNSLKEEWNK